MDDVVDSLTLYLANEKYLSYYQIYEVAKLIFEVQSEKDAMFLLQNIDYFRPPVGGGDRGLNDRWKNYPFYVFLLEKSNTGFMRQITHSIFNSGILDDCEISQLKLKYYRGLISALMDHDSNMIANYLNHELSKKDQQECVINNIEIMLSRIYQPERPLNKIIRN